MTTTPERTARLLVVDDDRTFRLSTAALLRADGHTVAMAASAQEAVEVLRAGPVDLVLLDLRMPGTDGLGMVEALRLWGDGVPVLMITGFGTVDSAVRALQVGVDDFLMKPVEPDVLSARVAALLERRPGTAGIAEAPGRMVGRTAAMLELFEAIRRVSPTEATVLVTGETGTGKELVARAVHEHSPRRGGPFLAVNCGALAEGLLESELFGHVRGAFSGAVRDKVGLFEAASGGTIFLDEIGEMGLPLQQRLLRVLQEREVTRVGAVQPTRVDVRVVAATHRDLRALVAAGRFRDDLFYRVNVFPLTLPPLRARRDDVPLLVAHALEQLAHRPAGRPFACSPFAMRLLRAYDWPGNVRELFAVLERAAIVAAGRGKIEAQHLPEEVRAAADRGGAESRYRRAADAAGDERAAIVAALEQTGGAVARAASLLGMGRTTLWRKMRDYGLPDGE